MLAQKRSIDLHVIMLITTFEAAAHPVDGIIYLGCLCVCACPERSRWRQSLVSLLLTFCLRNRNAFIRAAGFICRTFRMENQLE